MAEQARAKIAVLICTNVIGGHEFQMATLVRDLVQCADLTVYVNQEAHQQMFAETGAHTVTLAGQLLRQGNLLKQMRDGVAGRASLRSQLGTTDLILVSAGAVEAGVAASIALYGWVPMSLYLPFFYDRVPTWGRIGYLYNFVLSRFCGLYGQIVTINRIQASIIRALTGVKTIVVPNLVRAVAPAPASRPGRMLFIGRLDHQKRVDELIRWADFEDNPFKELLIIGDGPLRAQIEDIAGATRHIKVVLAGWLGPEQQDSLIDGNDVLLLNSLLEGEPLVIREANKRGIRVFSRNIIGVRGVTRRFARFTSYAQLRALLCSESPIMPKRPIDQGRDEMQRRRRALLTFIEYARAKSIK